MKYIEVPDFHFDPEWWVVSFQCADTIKKAAERHEVNFIALPGDFFNRPLYATDKSKYRRAIEIINAWSTTCPVVAIEGTPSHDGRGCYDPLNVNLLKLEEPLFINGIIPFKSAEYLKPECVIFGIPEIRNTPDRSGNQFLVEYIRDYIAPMRMKYENIPAFCLFHGNVSDYSRSNEIDVIKKNSEVVLHTEDMEIANMTRWTLGHIHTPWESEKINAGYAGFTGMDSNPWGKTDFCPRFNVIDQDGIIIERVPYGTPERKKVFSVADIKPAFDVAYWLETKNEADILPSGIHSWSRITIKKNIQETRRITQDQAVNIKTLQDLFKALDPGVSHKVLKKVDTITSEIKNDTYKKQNIKLLSVKIEGCVLFKEKNIEFNTDKLNDTLTALMGNNGSGKSSLLSFCSPYPTIIGKDTNSGRLSSIRDFFPNGGKIIKEFTVDTYVHKHIIEMTKSKTNCTLLINGEPFIQNTFDEMFTACESLYGNYQDFLMTYFYVQPQQGKVQSSLMNASMTEIRNLVQNIAGINREDEKRYALDRCNELEKNIQKKELFLSASEKLFIDIEPLKEKIKNEEKEIKNIENEIENIEKEGSDLNETLCILEQKKEKNDKLKEEKIKHDNDIENLHKQISDIDLEKEKKLSLIKEELDEKVMQENKTRELHYEIKEKYDQFEKEKNDAKLEHVNKHHEYATQQLLIKSLISEKDSITEKIEFISESCPNCGFIKNDVQEQIRVYETKIENIEEKLNIDKFPDPGEFKYPENPHMNIPAIMTGDEFNNLLLMHQKAFTADDVLKNKMELLGRLNDELNKKERTVFHIDYNIDNLYEETKNKLIELRKSYSEIKQKIDGKKKLIESFQTSIDEKIKIIAEIEEAKKSLEEFQINYTDWVYISKMLNPDKIPALELELFVDSIDAAADEIIKPYNPSICFRTETQKMGKKSLVDKFDIIVHNYETGEEKSFLKHSPGEKAFLNDAYTKALIQQRKQRTGIQYSPVIMDETDGPIQPERIQRFYEMQLNYFDGPVMIVSHNPESHNYIPNHINIEELKHG